MEQGTNWLGELAINPGMAVFRGRAGSNKRHSHWPHQISVAIEGELKASINELEICSNIVYIPSGHAHRLLGRDIVSIYIDPAHAIAQSYLSSASLAPKKLGELPDPLKERVQACRRANSNVDDFIKVFSEMDNNNTVDARLHRVIGCLWDGEGHTVDRAELSALVGLSPTRFSHWFKEQTGVPLRSYKKWLRLTKAIQFAFANEPLIDAAAKAGFSDQAHFSRTFSATFGVTASEIVAALNVRESFANE